MSARESNVRLYARNWPLTAARASGSVIYDALGKPYLDFFSGAGALNYGHNDPEMVGAVTRYLEHGGIIHALDVQTEARADFLSAIDKYILEPRSLDYLVQFTSPSGADAVEAAIKIARLNTGRTGIATFTGAFHGVTSAALSVSGDKRKRVVNAGRHGEVRLPYPGWGSQDICGIDLLGDLIDDSASGVDTPAGVIVETVQAEGGISVAPLSWLRKLSAFCQARDIVLIVDDIQTGCGRTGPFFSFEAAGIVPDVVCLAKSLSGLGIPLAVTLLRPRLDRWYAGQHTGTFRSNSLALVAGAEALRKYWGSAELPETTGHLGDVVHAWTETVLAEGASALRHASGRGLLRGLHVATGAQAAAVARRCFENGVLIETCGRGGQVLKVMPPLTISQTELEAGLEVIANALLTALQRTD